MSEMTWNPIEETIEEISILYDCYKDIPGAEKYITQAIKKIEKLRDCIEDHYWSTRNEKFQNKES